MAREGFTGPFARARRELRREEMSEFGGDLLWLSDYSLIPPDVAEHGSASESPYNATGEWMLGQLIDWSAKAHVKLDYQGVFDKHKLSADQRYRVRSMISMLAQQTFGPGIDSMCEVFEAAPKVATREGITDPKRWIDIASDARDFAASFAKNGTNVQAAVRLYLADATTASPAASLVPEKLKLDDSTGITTVIPIDRLVEIAIEVTEKFRVDGHTTNVCSALQAPVKGIEGAPTMYDAIWDAYSYVARTQLYPHYTPSTARPLSSETEDDVYRSMIAVTREMNEIEAAQDLGPPTMEEIFRSLGAGTSQVIQIY